MSYVNRWWARRDDLFQDARPNEDQFVLASDYDACEVGRKEAEETILHLQKQVAVTWSERDALAATVERARRMLTCIRDDNRGGRGEISYDEFSYKRREAELQDAARMALVAIDATPEPQPRLTDEMVEAAARELDRSNDWTGQRIEETVEGEPGGLTMRVAREILEAAEKAR